MPQKHLPLSKQFEKNVAFQKLKETEPLRARLVEETFKRWDGCFDALNAQDWERFFQFVQEAVELLSWVTGRSPEPLPKSEAADLAESYQVHGLPFRLANELMEALQNRPKGRPSSEMRLWAVLALEIKKDQPTLSWMDLTKKFFPKLSPSQLKSYKENLRQRSITLDKTLRRFDINF